MLHIITQLKQLYFGLVINNFAESFKAEEFSNLSEKDKESILKENTQAIIDYINSLDNVKDRILVSNFSNQRLDDFSEWNISENIKKDMNLRSILSKLGLDQNKLSEWIAIAEIFDYIEAFTNSQNEILAESQTQTNELKAEIDSKPSTEETENELKAETQEVIIDEETKFEQVIANSKVQPIEWKLYGYVDNWVFKLEIDDFVTLWKDPVYSFNKLPTTQEVEKIVNNFNNSKDLWGWENLPKDMTDTRVDNESVWKNRAKLVESTSKEVMWESKSSFLGMEFMRSDSKWNDYLKDPELKQLLHKDINELRNLYIELNNVLNKDWKVKFVDYKITSNYSDMYPILEKYGYDVPSTWLNDKEVNNIYTAIGSYLENQLNVVPKLDPKEKMKLLFDLDKDGKISTWLTSSIWEAQALYKTLESPTSQWAETLIKNLWFWSSQELFSRMETNLFTTREAFQDALKSALKTSELSILTTKDGPAKMWAELMERNALMQKQINRNIDLWFNRWNDISKLEYIWDMRREDFIDKLKRILTPDSLWLWVLDDQKNKELAFWGGLGYNVNLQELTYGLLDNFSLWISGNGVGWAISKDLLQPFREYLNWYKASLTVAIANGIPMVSASAAVLDQARDRLKSLSQQSIDTKTTVSLWATAWIWFLSWNINAIFRNENTVSGIEDATNAYQERLEEAKSDIMNGVSYEQSKLNVEWANAYDKQMYDLIVNMFKSETANLSDSQIETYFDKLFLPKFVQSYKDNLYKNKDGSFDVSTVSAWAVILPWMVVPFITAGWEYKYQEATENNRNLGIQEKVNYNKEFDATKIDMKVDNFEWKKVFKLPTTFKTEDGSEWVYQISSSIDNQQAVIKDWYIYLWGEISENDIMFIDHTDSNETTRTIIIKWWVKETNQDSENLWLYLPTKISWTITDSVLVEDVKDINKNLWTDLESFKEVEGTTRIIDMLISRETLWNKHAKGMMDLQKAFFEYRKTWTPALSEVYDKYMSAITNPWFKKYMEKQWNAKFLDELIDKSNPTNLSESSKVLILQSMANNFMKSSSFKETSKGEYELKEGNIKNYDKKRDEKFDKMMVNELGGLMGEKVQIAKKAWIERYGQNKDFQTVLTPEGTLWLTANVYKKNVDWLLPLSWVFKIVWIDWQAALEKMDNLSSEDKKAILKTLSVETLYAYALQLNQYGYSLDKSTVIDFIANGWDEKTKVNMETFFAKNGECLNDCIIANLDITIKWEQKALKIWATSTTSVWIIDNKFINLNGAYARTVDTKEKTVPETKVSTKPWEDEKPIDGWLDSNPWSEDTNSGNVNTWWEAGNWNSWSTWVDAPNTNTNTPDTNLGTYDNTNHTTSWTSWWFSPF